MALAIRLSRGGAKKRPYYRIVVTDSRSPRDGRFLEKIGTYNPLLAKDSPERVKLDTDRASHWLSVGAQPSDRVARFLDAAGVRTRTAKNNPNKAAPGEKAKERAEARATKAAEREAAAAEAAAAPAEEAPAEVEASEAEAPAAETSEAAADPVAVEAANEAEATTVAEVAPEPTAVPVDEQPVDQPAADVAAEADKEANAGQA